jgi:DNA-binding MarR family transcriptional regulator
MENRRRDEVMSEVGSLLHQMGRRMRSIMSRRFAELEVSPPMVGALHVLEEPLPMHTLAERLSCDASYITGLADRLEARGFVERRSDPDDRRVRQLALTDAGRAMRERLAVGLAEPNAMLDRLEDDELVVFAELLQKALDPEES